MFNVFYDAAGRHFPLTLARLGALPANQAAWLAAAETIGLDAIQDDLTPDELMRRLAAPFRTHPDGEAANAEDPLATWWTTGSPFVPATRLSLPALPDAEIFAAMLCAVPQEAAETQSDIPPAAGGVRE